MSETGWAILAGVVSLVTTLALYTYLRGLNG